MARNLCLRRFIKYSISEKGEFSRHKKHTKTKEILKICEILGHFKSDYSYNRMKEDMVVEEAGQKVAESLQQEAQEAGEKKIQRVTN